MNGLKQLLLDPELRCRLGVLGREYTIKVHDSNQVAKRLIDIYKSL